MAETAVNIYDAKSSFSRLVSRAESGERITITRNGRPAALLIPFAREAAPRSPGAWKGKVRIKSDFEFTEVEIADWYGE